MNDEARKKHLDESHERAVRRAMFAATDDLIRRRKANDCDEIGRQAIQDRFEEIEQRLRQLESAK